MKEDHKTIGRHQDKEDKETNKENKGLLLEGQDTEMTAMKEENTETTKILLNEEDKKDTGTMTPNKRKEANQGPEEQQPLPTETPKDENNPRNTTNKRLKTNQDRNKTEEIADQGETTGTAKTMIDLIIKYIILNMR